MPNPSVRRPRRDSGSEMLSSIRAQLRKPLRILKFEIVSKFRLHDEFEFFRNWKTTASLYYEARSGEPFSWVYTNDLNGDGQSGNDTLAVPDGPGDSRFDFSRMSSAQVESYFAFLDDLWAFPIRRRRRTQKRISYPVDQSS